MNKKHFIRNILGLNNLKFKHRKKIHYRLLAGVILLQISIAIIWYNESTKETEILKVFENLDSTNEVSQLSNRANNLFNNSQIYFNNYINYKDQISLKKYTTSLIEVKDAISHVSLKSNQYGLFLNIPKQKKELANHFLSLETTIDSIILLDSNSVKNQNIENFKFQKLEFKNNIDSLKTDPFIINDSISRKGMFSRLDLTIPGKANPQKEQLNNVERIKNKDNFISGNAQDKFKNMLVKSNNYYENKFNNLKKNFISLRNHDQKILKLNNQLLKLGDTIFPSYTITLTNLQNVAKDRLHDQYKSNIKIRKYTIVMLTLLMFIISIVLINFTRMAFDYEKKITKSKEKIQQTLKFKNKIMGMISHEIRSPLNIISIYSKKISYSIKDPEIKETFKSIHFTTNSLVQLANQILEYSKNGNYKRTLKCKKFNLKTEMHQIISSMSPLAEVKKNKIEINSNIDSNCEIYSDVTKIHQLFYNLIGNANKFTDNGQISITINLEDISAYERNLKVEIRDNGIGIAQNDLEKIFKSYYQSTSSRKFNDFGVGLGLNLCKEIVELFEGEINISSQEGLGTTVLFNLILSQN